MIERNFYNDDFEELLRDKTDQYKMYPSDNVWKGIYSTLHTRRKRFITGMSILISSILFFAGKELLAPSRPIANNKKNPGTLSDTKTAEAKPVTQVNPILAFSGLKKENLGPSSTSAYPEYQAGLERLTDPEPIGDAQADNTLAPSSNYVAIEVNATLSNRFIDQGSDKKILNSANISDQLPIAMKPGEVQSNIKTDGLVSANADALEKGSTKDEAKDRDQINWLAQNALANLVSLKKYKSEWQLYFSPTVNYRKISGGSDYSNQKPTVQNVPLAPLQLGGANNFIDNNPAVGFEVGGNILYRLTRNISLRAGLQFNYSRYTIKTYSSAQAQPATIVLNSISPYGQPQTYTNYSNIQNFGGKFPANLENEYFQLSTPVGIEMRIIGNGRLQFNIAGSVQPTYLFNRNSYLLTTDYSSYTQDPSLIRKWNVNGDIEAFLSYRLGAFHWQVGPQFGYQLLSTYTNKYPLKENLMEYGIKIGITKIIR
jgi:hypothetical protein